MAKNYIEVYLRKDVATALAMLQARHPDRSRSSLVQDAIIAAAAQRTANRKNNAGPFAPGGFKS